MKKIVVLLIVLFILAILICISPIVDYLYANAAEMSAEQSFSEAVTDTDAAESSAEDASDKVNETAVTGAVVLSTGTVAIAIGVFARKRRPES